MRDTAHGPSTRVLTFRAAILSQLALGDGCAYDAPTKRCAASCRSGRSRSRGRSSRSSEVSHVVSSRMHLAQMGVTTQLPALLNAHVYVGVDLVKQSR